MKNKLIPFKVTPTETIGNSIDLESTDKNNNGAASSNAEISEFREITLGRGQLTGILDNRLSRKQISMRYSLKSKQVFVKRIGINSSCIAKPNNEGLVEMSSEKEYELKNGEAIHLLPGLYAYQLTNEDTNSEKHVEKSTNTNENNNVQEPPNKKQKLDSKSNSKPILSTATNNNNNNNNNNDKNNNNVNNEISEKLRKNVQQLKDMFPEKTNSDLELVLKKQNNDLEASIDYLLTHNTVSRAGSFLAENLNNNHNNNNNNSNKNQNHVDLTQIEGVSKNDSKLTSNETQIEHPILDKHEQEEKEKADKILKQLLTLQRSDSGVTAALLENLQKAKEERERAEKEANSVKKLTELLMHEKEEAEKSVSELQRISKQLDTLYLPGEKEARDKKQFKVFTLLPKTYVDNDAASMHFRIAESQFYRLITTGAKMEVTKVEYIVNPKLSEKFKNYRMKLAEKGREWDDTKPILAFHGTAESNIMPICETNFDFSKIGSHTKNYGAYGKGIYFSELPGYSMGYVRNCSKILLCQIIPGKAYQTGGCLGAALEKGFDSHISSDFSEIVIFTADAILPSYIVHYKTVV